MKKSKDTHDAYQPIEDYGIIGNLHTVALISKKGSIDYMPFTRIDSPTIFGALLDAEKGGYFSICPRLPEMGYKQLYLPDTTILVTRFLSDRGLAELTDFMPVKAREKNCVLVRTISTIKGKIDFEMHCFLKMNYGKAKQDVRKEDDSIIIADKENNFPDIRIRSTVPLEIKEEGIYADFSLNEDEKAYFVLEAVDNGEDLNSIEYYSEKLFDLTLNYWKDWISQSNYRGRWQEIVNRSALTLKLLTSYDFGSVVAAATFGLPEKIGGTRNWDYRYTWIRDAAFTMYAFLRLGFLREAENFMHWIQENCLKKDQLQLLYKVDGGTEVEEKELDHLEGYRGSGPVRIGNAASKQFQLDIYGELIDTIYLFNKYGGSITYDFWLHVEKQIEFVCKNWQKPDHGIWEIRSIKREFLHSRIMCWVAVDRGIRVAEHRSFPYPEQKWDAVRSEIFKDIYNNFWDEEKKAFVQYKGSKRLDAAALLIPLMRIMSPVEPRWLSTLEAIEKRLVSDVLVYRYRDDDEDLDIDGIKGDEGTFTICSFWYVECLARAGKVDKARLHFEKMLGYSNHLGLYSEQLGMRGNQLGNFPQAFTHLALISAAYELDKDLTKKEKTKPKIHD